MKIKFDGDPESLKRMGEQLKANPAALDELSADPEGFLHQLGLNVDGETVTAIQAHTTRMGMHPSPASIVHIDL
ncbi:MAG: hypothetical protein M3362_20995 [Acidobacteriota bacterium]|nr:hypothetical protein [Acidobacteriota bacterium]